MTVFIGDFRGTLDLQSDALRVVHVGSALGPSVAPHIERDDAVPDSISALDAFADTRIYDYVAKAHAGSLDLVGFMQYRRAFPLGPLVVDDSPLGRLYDAARKRDNGEIKVSETEMTAYYRHLARLPGTEMFSILDEADIVVNRHSFGHMSVEEQFIQSQSKINPRCPEYIECWFAMKRAMTRLIGTNATETYLSSTYGFLNNCFLTRWDEFERYRSFLFGILSELKAWSGLHRVFGYQAERIFTAWVRLQMDTRPGYRVRSLPMFAATGSAPGPAMLAMRSFSDDRSLSLDLDGLGARFESSSEDVGTVKFGRSLLSVRLDAVRPEVTLRATLNGSTPGHVSARVWNAGNRGARLDVRTDERVLRAMDLPPAAAPPGQTFTLPYTRPGAGHTTAVELTFRVTGAEERSSGTALVILDCFRLGLAPLVTRDDTRPTPLTLSTTTNAYA